MSVAGSGLLHPIVLLVPLTFNPFQLSGTTDWSSSSLQTAIDDCVTASSTQPDILEQIQAFNCPQQCNDHGYCVAGKNMHQNVFPRKWNIENRKFTLYVALAHFNNI